MKEASIRIASHGIQVRDIQNETESLMYWNMGRKEELASFPGLYQSIFYMLISYIMKVCILQSLMLRIQLI
jgi:hypothetical protein